MYVSAGVWLETRKLGSLFSYTGFMNAYHTIKNFLLDLLFPIECLGCGMHGSYLCAPCFAKISVQESFVCPVCVQPSFENAVCKMCCKKTKLDGVIAASVYDNALLRRVLFAYKYRFIKALAEPLTQLLLKSLALHDYAPLHRNDLMVVPLPLSKRRYRWRGFNQAAELATLLARVLNLPIATNALIRARSTVPQTETESREERFKNISGAFSVTDTRHIKNKAILLVDDVATSLATLSECARMLKDAGAKEVWGLVVAREYLRK